MKVYFKPGDTVKLLADAGGHEPADYGEVESIDYQNNVVVVRVNKSDDSDSERHECATDEIARLTPNDKKIMKLIEQLRRAKSISRIRKINNNLARILKQEATQLHLNPTELDIIKYLAGGLSTREIAEQMKAAEATIETYRVRMLSKLNVKNTAEMIAYAFRHRMIRS